MTAWQRVAGKERERHRDYIFLNGWIRGDASPNFSSPSRARALVFRAWTCPSLL